MAKLVAVGAGKGLESQTQMGGGERGKYGEVFGVLGFLDGAAARQKRWELVPAKRLPDASLRTDA
jgi:hypothetical protein